MTRIAILIQPIELKQIGNEFWIYRGSRKLFGPYSNKYSGELKLKDARYVYEQDGHKVRNYDPVKNKLYKCRKAKK